MNLGPMGIVGSVAGTNLPQARGTETDRAEQEASAQKRRIESDKGAESAAGVGETTEDQSSSDRDADGRRLWERLAPDAESDESVEIVEEPRSRDASGCRGMNLDLSG
jgi:hypothetical protein